LLILPFLTSPDTGIHHCLLLVVQTLASPPLGNYSEIIDVEHFIRVKLIVQDMADGSPFTPMAEAPSLRPPSCDQDAL
jgi:hypothetical protein